MNDHSFNLSRSPQWYRNILNLYWMIVVLVLLLKRLALFVDKIEPDVYKLTESTVLQSALLLGLMLAAEALTLLLRRRSALLLILQGVLISTFIVMINPNVGIIPVVYLLPLIISLMTMNRGYIITAGVLSAVSYGLLYSQLATIRASVGLMELIGVLIMDTLLCTGALIVSQLMSQLFTQLRKTTEDQQYLLAQHAFMEKLSKMDALTGLYNHKTFHQYLDNLIEQCDSYPLSLQLAIFDIDNFKRVNDTYGHWVGDQVLLRVARVIQENITANDFAARYGGEEFAVLFTEKRVEEAAALLERIREQISLLQHEEMDGKSVTISIGLKHYQQSEGKELLFRATDESLYEAKKSGKNRLIVAAQRSGGQVS
jgi:diguanylate cyclase